MFLIEPSEHAPSYLKRLISAQGDGSAFSAVVMAKRCHTTDVKQFPALRDRTPEFERMLLGFGDGRTAVRRTCIQGHELAEKYGFKAVGAQYATTYDILWI